MRRGRTAGRALLLAAWATACLAAPPALAGLPAAAAGTVAEAATRVRAEAGTGDGAADARVVYCLARDHRAGLAGAAVSLRLATAARAADHVVVRGTELDLDAWRKADAKGFDRACKALYTASKDAAEGGGGAGGLGVIALVTILLPVAATAVLTVLTGEWRAARDSGRLRADALRTAARAFTDAASGYAGAWAEHGAGAQPPGGDVARARADLDARLREAQVLHRRWRALGALRAALAAGPLGDTLGQGWAVLEPAERRARAGNVRAALDALHARCEGAARALETPGRPHRAMKDAG